MLRLHTQKSFSADIQGLRAVAVALVFAYHLFPSVLPGGFVGVDVFFVISGYLITGLLLKELASYGEIALLGFYGRRIRRLLPAASTVLVAVACFHWLLPISTWEGLSQQLAASALYYQNWFLGLQSVDYLGSEIDPGPLQHFWSLAVEEQYYIVWPLFLIFISLVFTRNVNMRLSALLWSVAILFVVSLAHSVLFSSANPEMAYFASTTRAWELALGGLLNFYRPGIILRHFGIARFIGLAMIFASCFVINSDTLFPGYAALLPTLGTSLIIICSDLSIDGPIKLFSPRPMQYLGDVSYSLYLWHWPVVIFYSNVVGSTGLVDAVVIIALALGLADLSKRLLEDPLRRKNYVIGSKWPLLLGILCTGLSLLSAAFVHQVHLKEQNRAIASINAGSDDDVRPSPLLATQDRPALAATGCHTSQEETIPRVCSFGDESSAIHLALVGDSHALQWSPAFREIAAANGWRFTLLTKSACSYAPILVGIGSPARPYDECLEWGNRVAAELQKLKPTHVIVAQSRAYRVFGEQNRERNTDSLAAAYAQSWVELQHLGIEVLAIRDTPRMTIDAPQCLTTPDKKPEDCFSERVKALPTADRPDPLLRAAERVPDVFVLDMSDHICGPTLCSAVSDNILIWRDRHHLTSTFVKSLKPVVAQQMAIALGVDEIRTDQPEPIDHVSQEVLKAAAADLPAVYERRCFNRADQHPLKVCEFGTADSTHTIALVGDSRAAQWSPALIEIAKQRRMRVVTLLNASCPLGEVILEDRDCSDWAELVRKWIDENRPDILVVSQSRGYRVAEITRGPQNAVALANAFENWLDEIGPIQGGVHLIADTPRLRQNPLECLESANSDASLICATRKEAALPDILRPDPLALVAQTSNTAALIDINSRLCPPDGNICPPLIEGEITWRTKYLLTATFASSMSGTLERLIFDETGLSDKADR